jgi:CheY-like chemotaxis protein
VWDEGVQDGQFEEEHPADRAGNGGDRAAGDVAERDANHAEQGAGDHAIAAAAALRPDVVVVDVSPAADAGFGLARRLSSLPHPPAVVLTSSADPAEFGTRLDGHSFVAKAGLCAETIDAAARRASLRGCRRTGHGR